MVKFCISTFEHPVYLPNRNSLVDIAVD